MTVPGCLIAPFFKTGAAAEVTPVIESTTTFAGARATSHNISWPSGISSGELIVCLLATEVASETVTWPAGWTVFKTDSTNNPRVELAWYEADGTESGTFTVTTATDSKKVAANTYRISGAADPDTTPPECSSGATATSVNANPDSLTPAGGSKPYMWLALAAWWSSVTVTEEPSGYLNHLISHNTGGFGDTMMTSAQQGIEASSEDPGTFTNLSAQWKAFTVAIYPA